MLCNHWSLFVSNNISENTYFTILYIYLLYYFIFHILSYIFVSKLKVHCIDPHLKHIPNLITSDNKAMLITLSES